MHVVIFEFTPHEVVATDRYFELAGELRSEIEKQPGFISVQRFEHVQEKGHFVSISTWENEAAIRNWKANLIHQKAQHEGKTSLFRDYRIRVAEVIRDYALNA